MLIDRNEISKFRTKYVVCFSDKKEELVDFLETHVEDIEMMEYINKDIQYETGNPPLFVKSVAFYLHPGKSLHPKFHKYLISK